MVNIILIIAVIGTHDDELDRVVMEVLLILFASIRCQFGTPPAIFSLFEAWFFALNLRMLG